MSAFLFLCAIPAAFAATPLARIVYTGNTEGHVLACVSCQGGLGGLARRAHALRELAAGTPRPLIIAGPNEFYADRPNAAPASGDAVTPVLHAAFSAMPYTAVYVSPKAAARFAEKSLPPLPGAVPVADAPVVEYFRANGVVTAFVFLPPLRTPGPPAPSQVAAITVATREASQNAALVIVVSPWGMARDDALLSVPRDGFHILLGGGPGIAVPGQPGPGEAAPLWVRPDRLGRAISVIDVHAIPPPSSPWLEGIHYESRLLLLEENLPEDEEVKRICEAAPKGALD